MLPQFTKLKYEDVFFRRQLLLIKRNFWAISDELSPMNLLTVIPGLEMY